MKCLFIIVVNKTRESTVTLYRTPVPYANVSGTTPVGTATSKQTSTEPNEA